MLRDGIADGTQFFERMPPIGGPRASLHAVFNVECGNRLLLRLIGDIACMLGPTN